MAQNVVEAETIKKVISDRFADKGKPIPFEFKAISRDKDKELKKSCTKKVKMKGTYINELDTDAYMDKFVASSIVFPNLKDADLQASYGVMGEVNLLKKMLLPGEFSEALQVTQEVNGYDKDMSELVEEAKN